MSVATDHALATIASILAPPEAAKAKPAQPEKPTQSEKQAQLEKQVSSDKPAAAAKPIAKLPFEAAGYSKTGPGPMAAIRIRWTVRHGDDGYYVDETIGADSVPVMNGPMSGDAAVSFVDERARDARERFEALKSEMTGLGPPAPILIAGAGEK